MDNLTEEEKDFLRKEMHLNEYELMYYSGEWHHYETIFDVCDESGIADADEMFAHSCLENWPYGIALWKVFPNRELLKTYIEAKPLPPTEKQTRPLNRHILWASIRIEYVSENGEVDSDVADLVENKTMGLAEDGIIIKEVLIHDIVPKYCID